MKQTEKARAEYLRALQRETLQALVLERAKADEEFASWLDTRLVASLPPGAGGQLESAPFGRRAEALFRAARPPRHSRHRTELSAAVDEAALEEMIDAATPLLKAGDGCNTLAILMPMTEALAEYWPECADWDETLHEYFPRLDRMIAQAVLMDDVSQDARDDLVDTLDCWQDDLSEYGADDAFAVAIAACMRGWDEPDLADALAGRVQNWPIDGKADLLEDNLTRARLAALDASGRTAAYLHLSLAAGFHCDHAVKLTQMGRVDEAIALAYARLSAPCDLLRLSRAVVAADQLETGLQLAAWGLSLPARVEGEEGWRPGANRLSLARWLRKAAQEAGRQEIMLMAAQTAFEESLTREDFRTAETLAGPSDWPRLRETLLAVLMAAAYAFERIEILLDEDMIDEAVACVDPQEARFLNPQDEALERLAERAYADYPDWAIALAFRMADPIMAEGKSDRYETAAQWLGIAARAYAVRGRSEDWLAHLETLMERHRRKHKLRPLLEALAHAAD